jgi:hypothetical protein
MDQAEPERFGLFDHMEVSDRLRAALGGFTVDLATPASLHPALRPAIEASALPVFCRPRAGRRAPSPLIRTTAARGYERPRHTGQ